MHNEIDSISPTPKMDVQQILDDLETDKTKLMNNEQLQRFVLLQQLKVVTLQQKRLEYVNNIENAKNVEFDLIGFEVEMDGVNPT